MYFRALVAVENTAIGFDKEYSYHVPEPLFAAALAGCRCTVPFGGGNRKRTGIILGIEAASDISGLKPLLDVLDPAPLLDAEGLFLLRYIRETSFCTWFDALKLLIPAGIGVEYGVVYSSGGGDALLPLAREIVDYVGSKRSPVPEPELNERFGLSPFDGTLAALAASGALIRSERTKRRVADEKEVMLRFLQDVPPGTLTPKQKKAAAFLKEAETASLKELCYYAGVTRVVADGLVKKGAAEYFDCVRLRNPYKGKNDARDLKPPELTQSQREVFDELYEAVCAGGFAPVLLYGVTGSGKTEVFLNLIKRVAGLGKSVIVLVPEISLAAQTVEVFHRRFGRRVAVLHSGLSMGERMDEWRRIAGGGADIVVGTRSAVFAPLKNIGLIVMDEEQENAYKSDKSPRYHARDIAHTRCAYHKAMLLFSSATPSVESYHAAVTGKYRLLTLGERFNQGLLPDVTVIDMRDPANSSAYPALSAPLLEELHDNLARGEQSILLLNRRGHSTLIRCSSCGAVAECPNCSVALTYHNANDSLLCHYCGYARPREDGAPCALCGSELIRYAGIGTQKLEEQLRGLFPVARLLRVDMDTTMSKFAHEKLFGAFLAGEYDIMLGTQMVAKGLNFPNVTLVGVLQPDQSLFAGDFRSFERTFSLLTQVVGRGGRGDKRGRACIQTYAPDNPVIGLAAEQMYHAFYGQEIKLRRIHLYPPFCSLFSVGFSGAEHSEVKQWAQRFANRFTQIAGADYPDLPLRLLGPSPDAIPKAAGKYRYKLVIKCKNNRRTRQLLWSLLEWFAAESKKVSAHIDTHC